MRRATTKFIILFIYFLVSNGLLFSQKNTEISAGVGIPELLFFKINHGVRFQPGLSIGYFPKIFPFNPTLLSLSGDFSFHFPKNPKNIKNNTWYVKSGMTLLITLESYGNDYDCYFNARFGRTFFLKKNAGINLDLGVSSYFLSILRTGTIVRPLNTEEKFRYPSLSISYFIKL